MKSHEKDTLELGELVRLYHVGFRIQPGKAVVASGRITQITCRLELSGHHDSHVKCADAPCMACIRVFQSLFEVTDTLRPIERETLENAGGACETRAHYASATEPGHEETLGLEMTLRCPVGAVTDSWAWIFMQRVRTALMELGCLNRAPRESVGCRPPFRTLRRARIQRSATSSDAMERELRLTA